MLLKLLRFLFLLLFFTPLSSLAQDWRLTVISKIEKDGGPCEGATITFYKNGKQVDQKITGADGKFRYEFEPNGDYRMEVTKVGCIKKLFTFNTKGVSTEDASDQKFEFNIKAIELFEQTDDCDVSQLNKPLIKVAFDPNKKAFEMDEAYSNLMLDVLAQLEDCRKLAVANTKKYNKAMQDGQNAMNKKDYQTAIARFTEAMQYRPKSEEAAAKKKEAEDILAGGAKMETDYKAAMAAGAAAVAAKDYDKAIAEYTKAGTIKPKEAEPPKKVEEVRNLKKAAEADAEFNKLLQDGAAAMTAKEYQKAMDLYVKAKGLKSDHPEPPKKIAELKVLLDNLGKYDAAMKKGNEQLSSRNWDASIAAFTEALAAKKDDPEATKKLAEANAAKAKDKAEADQQKKFDDAMKAGNAALSATKWDDAITQYKIALDAKKDDATATAKMKEAENGKKKAEEAAKTEAAYKAAMDKGSKALTEKKWQDAVAGFTEALGVKKDDAPAKQKLAEANAGLEAWKKEQGLQAQYDEAMKRGNDAGTARKWDAAITAYKEALNLKKDDAVAKQKLTEAETAKKAEEDAAKLAELQKKYDEAMKRGNDAFAAKKYDDAIKGYNDALVVKTGDETAKQKIAEVEAAKLSAADAAKQAEIQKKYDEAMKRGNDAFAAKKYDDAIKGYNDALVVKTGDETAKQKIADVEAAKLAAADAAKQAEIQKKYDEAMKRGNDAMTAKKYDDAIKGFSYALVVKAEDAAAKTKLADAEAAKKASEEGKKVEELYSAAMNRGKDAMTTKKYEEAITAFNEALTHKKEDVSAKTKLNEATAALEKLNADAEAQKKYDDAMARGTAAMNEKKWSDAIAAYSDALAVKKDDPTAKVKKTEAETNQKKEMGEAQLQKKYEDAMAKGKSAVDASKWQEAVNAYKEALTYKKDDSDAAAKLKDAETKLKEENDKLAAERNYEAAMKEGETAFGTSKYQLAVDAFKKALTFKKDDAVAVQKLTEAEAKLKEAGEKAASKKQYDEAMARGNVALKGTKWGEAILGFKDALTAIPDDATASAKLKEAEEGLKKQTEKEGAEKEYQLAMEKGNSALAEKNYQSSIDAYNNALVYKPNDALASKKKAEAEAALKLIADNEKNFNDLLTQGKNAFDNQEWQKALDAYKKAKTIKSDHPEPSTKIPVCEEKLLEEKLMKDAAAKIETEYQKHMKEGASLYTKKLYEEALKQFISASDLKKEEAEPKNKIKEIEDLLAQNKNAAEQAKKLEEDFQAALKEGDAAVSSKDYTLALEKFNFAKQLKPAAPEPPKRISDVNKLIDGDRKAKQLEEEYARAMKEGEDAEQAMNWTAAIKAYRDKALVLKPGDPEAKRKLEESEKAFKDKAFADSVAQAQKDLAEKFNKLINDARAAYTAKDFKTSLSTYEAAHNLKKDEPEPPKKIEELKLLIKQMDEEALVRQNQDKLDKEYQKAMDEGNKAVLDKKYQLALDKFKHAQNLKATEKDPPQRIEEVEEILRKLKEAEDQAAIAKENERKYKEAMKSGEVGVTKKDYVGAKKLFEEALSIKTDDALAKQRIEFVNGKLREIGENEKEIKYKAAITRGANDEKLKKYPEAITAYKDALVYKPSDAFAQQKITELQKLIKNDAVAVDNTKKEDKWAKYPQGTTTETVSAPGCITIRTVVKKGEDVQVFEKKHYNWGGTTYFRDGQEITGTDYQAGIK